MAPLTYPLKSLKRSEIAARSSETPSFSLGETVGIAIGIGLVCSFALVTFVYFIHIRRKQRKTPRVRREARNGMESGAHGTTASAPRKGLGRVFSVFTSKRRQQTGAPHTPPSHDELPQGEARPQPRQLPDKDHVELQGGYVEDDRTFIGAEATPQLSPFNDVHRQADSGGSVPPGNPVQRVDSTGHCRSESQPPRSSVQNLEMQNIAMNTDAPKAAWHSKRTGPLPPLTIEPPGMLSQSPSDAYSAHSTYATSHSVFTYGSINIPDVPPVPTHVPNDHYGTQVPYDCSPSKHLSLTHHYPPSPETPGSIPSMSRSDSGVQESFPVAPPTPTYAQPHQRIPEDANFECLGPLPANIPIPPPPHFRTPQQQDPFLTPLIRTPVTDPNSSTGSLPTTSSPSTKTPAGAEATAPVGFTQDPLLHATDPFRPHHHSPVLSTFAFAARSAGTADRDEPPRATSPSPNKEFSSRRRRDSTDSLGSNFTVEEEARIQAQIVKNLDALDKERVMGEDDIVHIPQISTRRYSWEE